MNKIFRAALVSCSLFATQHAFSDIVFPTPHDGGTTVPKLPANLYLRCGSTSTTANAQSRLQPFTSPDVYTIVYEVKNPDALTRGDNCILTATTQPDTIGADSINFTVMGQAIQAPGFATPKFGDSPTPFNIRYSSLRSYRAILSLTNPPNLMIMPANGQPDGSEPGDGDIGLGF